MPGYLDSFAREAISSTNCGNTLLPVDTKIDHFATQIPRWQYITKTYYLLYFHYILQVPKPSKYRHFGTQNHSKCSFAATLAPFGQLSGSAGASSAAKLVPRCQLSCRADAKLSRFFAREAIWSHKSGNTSLAQTIKIDHFATRIPRWQYITKTYYLLYFHYILQVPKPSKYRYFGTPNHS